MSYRLYVDETGDHFRSDPNDLGQRYLGLTGVCFDREPYFQFQAELEEFKRKHLPYDPTARLSSTVETLSKDMALSAS